MSVWKRDNPWRQGSLLSTEANAALSLFHPDSPDNTAAMIISHDCDLAQDPEVEPLVEIILGRIISESDGNFTHAKNSRKLHIQIDNKGIIQIIELEATKKKFIPKLSINGLVSFSPNTHAALSAKNKTILQHWLAARYRRSAFPDEFDLRLKNTKVRNKLIEIIKKHGNSIEAIFFDIDEGKLIKRIEKNDTYLLQIYLIYKTDQDPDFAEAEALEACKKIKNAFESRCLINQKNWEWIELIGCDTLSDEALTYTQSRYLTKWNTDHISLQEDLEQRVIE